MCEWLSCGEWCDVRLTCAGRTFSAHRPVLASVSAFLRRVLLSCPLDETPTFIVLPDFDLDAMSAVLFYIYNGEVSVEKRKLTLFLEIIRTLEIFVDEQCLQKLRECVGVRNLDLCTYRESRCSKNVFTLSSGNSNEHEYVNIRKGERVQDVRVQNSMSKSHLIEKNRCRRNVQTTLENLPTFFGDRQRNCFLRDLYIETYPQNGNVNGLTGGVLAISSERYRAPTSVLLTNANGKLPGSVDAVLSDTRKSTENMSFIPNISNKQFHCIQNCSEPRNEMYVKRFYDNGNVKNLTVENTKNLIESYNLKSAWMNRLSSQICSQSLSPELQSRYLLTAGPSLDLSTVPKSLDSLVPSFSLSGLNIRQSNVERGYMKCHLNAQCSDSPSYYKAPIFNHVLESPWCPRLPYTYKPFKRKAITVSVASRDKKGDIAISNDNNNNIDQKPLSVQSKEEEENVGTKEKFKCSICNQVFFDEEGLTCHSKRHTTAARYSCGECGKTFSQLRNFKYHMSVHRGTREFAATCTVCGKYFNDRGYLSSHMKIHRNRKEYKCSLCPKSFNQRVAYNMHVRIHTGVKPHVCDECGKAFSRKMLLKQHQRTHSGERPYACPHCDKRFADRSNMTLHLRLHTGVKPFSCSLCSKSFTKKHHLKSHLNFHTGAKPYSCPRCKLAFTQSSNMRTHLKKCTAPENIGSV